VAVALALMMNVAAAAPVNRGDRAGIAALEQFYPTPLASSPVGVVEDQAVWTAKVQGLIANAPQWLQQNVLSSQTKEEFVANLALLEQMQKGTLEQGAGAVKALAKAGKLGTKAGTLQPEALDPSSPLGGGNGDLVYTALTPCRIMDSRTGGGGLSNPLAGNHLYSIPGWIATNWGLYGGNAGSNCGLTNPPGNNIWAVAIVITILNPNADAFLGVSDSGTLATVLSSVALNFTHGQGLSSTYIVPQTVAGNNIFFAMPAGLTANLIFDVVGYFAVSEATALQCTYPSVAGSGSIAAGAVALIATPTCPAGYTKTGAGCYGDAVIGGVQMVEVSVNAFSDCIWRNDSGATQAGTNYHAETACCRVPGR